MITGAVIMAVGVLLGAAIAGMNKKQDNGPHMSVVRNHPTASTGD